MEEDGSVRNIMSRGKSTRTKVQDAILKERGLEVVPGGLVRKVKTPTTNTTLAMRLLEEQYGVPIKSLIEHGSIKEVAEFLGLEESTVSKWRLRLGLRTMVYRG